MLFFTGFARNASDIAAEQIKVTLNKKDELNKMLEICSEGMHILNNETESLDRIGFLPK